MAIISLLAIQMTTLSASGQADSDVAKEHSQWQQDHQQWDADHKAWEKDHAHTIAVINKLKKMMTSHETALKAHEKEISAHQKEIQMHDQLLQKPNLTAGEQKELSDKHEKSKVEHERVK